MGYRINLSVFNCFLAVVNGAIRAEPPGVASSVAFPRKKKERNK